MVCAAIAVALLTAAWRFLTFTGFNNDHYIYLAGAQQIVLGEWPIRDFVDPGWPLMYGVSAVARLLFGRELWVELLVVASAFAIGAGFTLTAAARLSGSIALALMVTLLEIGLNPRSFGYPKLLLYAIAGWAFVAATRQMTPRRAVLLAALTVVAFLFRHDHGLYIGAGSFVAVVLGSAREGSQVTVRRAAVFAAAVLLFVLPWVIFVQYQVGLIEYFKPALEFSRAEAEGTVLRSLPWTRFLWRRGRGAGELGSLVVLSVLCDASGVAVAGLASCPRRPRAVGWRISRHCGDCRHGGCDERGIHPHAVGCAAS